MSNQEAPRPVTPDVEGAFDPELRQARDEWAAYLDGRPTEDERGMLQSNGQYEIDDHFDQKREDHYNDTQEVPHEEASMSELVNRWATAEKYEDRTRKEEVESAILDRVNNAEGFSDDEGRSQYMDRLFKWKDKVKAEMGGDAPKADDKEDKGDKPESDDADKKDGEDKPEGDDTDKEDKDEKDEKDDDEEGDDDAEQNPIPPEVAARIEELNRALPRLRDDYARRVAGRSRRAIHIRRDFRASGVEEARLAYEQARDELGGIIASLYAEGGASAESINVAAWSGAAEERKALVQQIRAERLLATGGNRYARETNPDGTVIAVARERGRIRGAVDAFYGWYARNSLGQRRDGTAMRGGRVAGIAKNTVAVGALGLGGGIAVGMLAGGALPVGAGVTAGIVANRITKAWMAGRIRRNVRGTDLLVDQRSRALNNDILEDFGDVDGRAPNTADITGAVTRNTRREVRGNRIRESVSTLATAAGAVGLEHFIAGDLPDLHLGQRLEHLFGNGGKEAAKAAKGAKTGGAKLPKGVVPGETPLRNIDLKGAEYPWDWAANRFGSDHATPELLELVKKAREAGVDAQTHQLPNGRFDISVNGNTNTQYVVNWLDRFVNAKK